MRPKREAVPGGVGGHAVEIPFQAIQIHQWTWCLQFLHSGGPLVVGHSLMISRPARGSKRTRHVSPVWCAMNEGHGEPGGVVAVTLRGQRGRSFPWISTD